MVEVTDADRERAEEWRWALLDPMAISPVEDSQIDVDALSEAFARHRIAAEQRGKLEGARLALEAAAKSARDYAAKAKGRGWMPHADSAPKAAQHIASNIRVLDPAKIVGER